MLVVAIGEARAVQASYRRIRFAALDTDLLVRKRLRQRVEVGKFILEFSNVGFVVVVAKVANKCLLSFRVCCT